MVFIFSFVQKTCMHFYIPLKFRIIFIKISFEIILIKMRQLQISRWSGSIVEVTWDTLETECGTKEKLKEKKLLQVIGFFFFFLSTKMSGILIILLWSILNKRDISSKWVDQTLDFLPCRNQQGCRGPQAFHKTILLLWRLIDLT